MDLVGCLVKSVGHIPELNAPVVDVKIFDGPTFVYLLQPKGSAAFDDYAKDIVLPYLEKCLQDTSGGDIEWDVYHTDSLKQFTSTKHGKGKLQHVVGKTKISQNWETYFDMLTIRRGYFHLLIILLLIKRFM